MTLSDNKGGADDPLLTLAEVASYLKLAEKTVLRMIHRGEIPGIKIANQWRFVPSQMDRWLSDQAGQASVAKPADEITQAIESQNEAIPLSRLTDAALIRTDIQPGEPKQVLRQLVAPLVDFGLLADGEGYVDKLLRRELIISTGVGGGVAIPHVRNPRENPVARPYLMIGICQAGTDYNAIDGSSTHLFLLLLAASEITHLRILARINQYLMVEGVIDRLTSARSPQEVMRMLIADEQKFSTSEGGQS